MRTVFLGTSQFAATILTALAQTPHQPTLVLTRPDRPAGRGRRLTPPPVAETARQLDIPLAQPEDVNSTQGRARIASERPQAVCVCAFGALIREPLLSEHLMLNVHPSVLPRWRGAAPVERAIIAGDGETGVSIMQLEAGLDSGPVCAQTTEPINASDTYGTLAARLAIRGAVLLAEVLDDRPQCAPQPEQGVTYAEKIGREDRQLDPHRPASELERIVRALSPHIGAFVELPSVGRLGVLEAGVRDAAGLPPGELSLEGTRPVLGTGAGGLELLLVQPPGKRAMSGEDFLRGRRG